MRGHFYFPHPNPLPEGVFKGSIMSDGFYNIVLIPDKQTGKILTDLAFQTYSKIADGYCLEDGKVFPHITLTQFYTQDIEVVKNIENDVKRLKLVSIPYIYFTNFGARFWKSDAESYLWIGLSNKNTSELADFQRVFHEIILSHNLKPLNGSLGNYAPHVTFARILASTTLPEILIPNLFITDNHIGDWSLAIGHSDKNGQFLGAL
jgi:2'-5' RNA ligase